MPFHERTRVAVLRGGPSSEYNVSLKTGASVLANLPEHYHPLDVFISRDGAWHLYGKREEPHRILQKVDVVWNALHGEYGEDGGVQHLLEEHHIPFSGSARLAAALATNKSLAKQILAKHGIKTPYFKVLRREDVGDFQLAGGELYRTFPQPSVIKPVAQGSSVGASLARTPEEIAYALDLAFFCGDVVLVEEYVKGTEVVGGVIEGFRGAALYRLLPVGVTVRGDAAFLDYRARMFGAADFRAPADISREQRAAIQELAEATHRLLGLRHYSTTDFIVHPTRGIYFLEIDALPQLSPQAPFIVSLCAVGATLPQFLGHVLQLSRERY